MPIDVTRPLELMISSRCGTRVRGDDTKAGSSQPLSTVRKAAKHRLEALFTVGTEKLFRVWINEDERRQSAGETWYSASEKRAQAADIVIVLFTGDPGRRLAGKLGVCHAELAAAMADTPTKVRVVDLRSAITAQGDVDAAFVNEVDGLSLITEDAHNAEEAVEQVCGQALAAARTLARHGLLDVRRRSRSGADLAWDRLSFEERKRTMEEALADALLDTLDGGEHRGDVEPLRGIPVIGNVDGRPVLFVCHAVPVGLSVDASREMVGQPFLHDHLLAELLDPRHKRGAVGPVHVIASPHSVTEAQARRLLGFPDATVVKDTWGIWVSDSIQRIQLLLLDRCTGLAAMRARVQQAFSWLHSTGEGRTLVERAWRRASIALAMADISAQGEGAVH